MKSAKAVASRSSRTSRREDDGDDAFKAVRRVDRVSNYRSFVLYGRSGTGKTTIASTFPKPMLLLDVRDRGTDSIADVKDIDVWEIEELEDFEKAYYALKKHPGRYKTVVIDTLTQIQQMMTVEVVADRGGNAKRAGDWGSMKRQDWGDVSARMKEWIMNYRDLVDEGINVVFIAQDRVFNSDEEDGGSDDVLTPEVAPALIKSVVTQLNASVHVIGNTYIRHTVKIKEVDRKKIKKDVKQYCLRVGPNPIYTTKIRKPRGTEAPDYIVDATYDDILAVIKGE